MKALILLFFVSLFTFGTAFAQKKDIDTDVLITLIDKKQQEAALRLITKYMIEYNVTDSDKEFVEKSLLPLLSFKKGQVSSKVILDALRKYDYRKSTILLKLKFGNPKEDGYDFDNVFKINYPKVDSIISKYRIDLNDKSSLNLKNIALIVEAGFDLEDQKEIKNFLAFSKSNSSNLENTSKFLTKGGKDAIGFDSAKFQNFFNALYKVKINMDIWLDCFKNLNSLLQGSKDSEKVSLSFRSFTQEQVTAIENALSCINDRISENQDKNITLKAIKVVIASIYFKENEKESTFRLAIDNVNLISNTITEFSSDELKNRMEFHWLGRIFIPRPMLNIGLNTTLSSNSRSYYFASEKLGVRFLIKDWSYIYGQKNGVEYKRNGTNHVNFFDSRDPLVSKCYWSLFVSGVLYNVANLRSAGMPNDPIVGAGLNFELYNKLTLSLNYGSFLPNSSWNGAFSSDNSYIGIGIDVPIVEYISALRAK